MNTLNPEQQVAVETQARHCLVLAGAGTGKTTTIINRCAHLLASGVDEQSILVITFTRKAASEVRSRLSSRFKRPVQIFAGTFHGFSTRLMRKNPELFGISSPTLIDREDALYSFKSFKKQHSTKFKVRPAELLDAHSLAVNTRLSMSACLSKLGVDDKHADYFEKASAAYASFKQERNYVDYDDILELLATALQNAKVAKAIGQRFKHVLIDEMQDTNPLQWLIIDALVPYCSLYCVGDDAQSIYGFRGADFESIHSFQQRVAGAVVLKLTKNYRSTQEILDLSNWLLGQSPLAYDKWLEASRGKGIRPTIVDCEDDFEQGSFITQKIVDAYGLENRWSNNMVLVRSSYQARAIETRFMEAEVPYVLIGGLGLLGAKHIKDLLSVMRILANHSDEIAWHRYLELWTGIGEKTAGDIFNSLCGQDGALVRGENRVSLAQELDHRAQGDKFGWVEVLRTCLGETSPAKIIDRALEGLEPQMASNYREDNWEGRRRDFIFLRELATKHNTVAAFVDDYLLHPVYEKEMQQPGENDVVRLITIHSAKGLEAKRCFVTDVQPGNYPSARSKEPAEIEEERRVLYVALTRAQDELYLCRSWRGWHASNGDHEAFFFNALPTELFDSKVSLDETAGSDEIGIKF